MPGAVSTVSGDFVSKAAESDITYRYSVSWLVETRIIWKAVVRPDRDGRGVIVGGERPISLEDVADLERIARHAVEEAIKAGAVLPDSDPSGG